MRGYSQTNTGFDFEAKMGLLIVGLPLLASLIAGPMLIMELRSNGIGWLFRTSLEIVLVAMGLGSLKLASESNSFVGWILIAAGIFCVCSGGLALVQGFFLDLIVGI